jgi:2'-phosphotransferase
MLDPAQCIKKMSEQRINLAAPATAITNPKKNTNLSPIKNTPGKKNKRNWHQQRNKNGVGDPSGATPAGKGDTSRQKPMSEKKLSHSLSWALRHAALNIGLTIREDGYVPVQEILDSTHPKLRGATLEIIQTVVEKSDKKRFKLEERPMHLYYPEKEKETLVSMTPARTYNDDHDGNGHIPSIEEKNILCIRANQGHSITMINPELLLKKLSPDELRSLSCIVHGTYPEAWESIRKEQVGGLKKMNRTHIHFASGLPTDDGVISGMRKNCAVYIFLDASKCAADDRIDFYMSENGVILTDGIASSGVLPINFFSRVTDSSGKILLENRDSEVK